MVRNWWDSLIYTTTEENYDGHLSIDSQVTNKQLHHKENALGKVMESKINNTETNKLMVSKDNNLTQSRVPRTQRTTIWVAIGLLKQQKSKTAPLFHCNRKKKNSAPMWYWPIEVFASLKHVAGSSLNFLDLIKVFNNKGKSNGMVFKKASSLLVISQIFLSKLWQGRLPALSTINNFNQPLL